MWMPLVRRCNCVAIALASLLFAVAKPAFSQALVLDNQRFHVTMDRAGGYQVQVKSPGWNFSGNIGAPVRGVRASDGSDALGSYTELRLQYRQSGNRQAAIRIYKDRPVAVLSMTMVSSGSNAAQSQGSFPAFNTGITGLHRLGFQVVPFGIYRFNYLGPQGPWVLFNDAAQTLVVSPLDHFFITQLEEQASGFSSRISNTVTTLPRGFEHAVILVGGEGINRTFEAWGRAMQTFAGRKAPDNQADVLLQKLSYWTDNGAEYYYKFDSQLGYAGTLLALSKEFAASGVPLGSVQLDSWFYPKGPDAQWNLHTDWAGGVGGAYLYQPDSRLFPGGLAAFQSKREMPLVTHARWIDRASPYRKQYRMSGDIIVDPSYWKATAQWLRASGVQVYEQDWLGSYAHAENNLQDPEAYHDQMGHAMEQQGLTMQYCMASPADYLQGTRYSNLTTIRTSNDRFEPSKWDSFLFDSRLASALGIWPWSDVFYSRELGNLVLSTLSAGPVGVGDRLNDVDVRNLQRAVRADGVIIKPDLPIVPLDHIYVERAGDHSAPMIATTSSHFGDTSVAYAFAYPHSGEADARISPKELGFTTDVYVYDWNARHGAIVYPDDNYTLPLTGGWGYAIVSPLGPAGIAFIGDTDEIVTAGHQRVSELTISARGLNATIDFAPSESTRTITLYSVSEPHVIATTGKVLNASYDPKTRLSSIDLGPGAHGKAEILVTR